MPELLEEVDLSEAVEYVLPLLSGLATDGTFDLLSLLAGFGFLLRYCFVQHGPANDSAGWLICFK